MKTKTESQINLVFRKTFLEDVIYSLKGSNPLNEISISIKRHRTGYLSITELISIPSNFIDTETCIKNLLLQITLEIAKIEDQLRILNTDSNE